MISRPLLLAFAFALGAPAMAQRSAPQHGIARYGEPKYPRDFSHFSYNNPNSPQGGELSLGVLGTFDSLNPFKVEGIAAAGLQLGSYLYFEPLMMRSADEPFTLYGYIAESIEVADDFSWVEFRLRPQATWHDGTPISADDVMFSSDFFREHGRINQRQFYSQIERTEKKGEHTVRFYFKVKAGAPRDSEMPMILALLTIIPKKEANNPALTAVSTSPLMGSGPYRIDRVEPGKTITFTRNLEHWAKDLPCLKGMHNFSSINFRYFSERKAMQEAFNAGSLSLLSEQDPEEWRTAYNSPALRQGKVHKLALKSERPVGQRLLMFNMRNPLLQERRIREALILLFDAKAINRQLYQGMLTRHRSYFDNSSLAAKTPLHAAELALLQPWKKQLAADFHTSAYVNDESHPYSARSAVALQLFKLAGWEQREGKMRNPQGKECGFEILLFDAQEEKLIAPYVQALVKFGINASSRIVAAAEYDSRRRSFDFDAVIHHYGQSLSPGNEQAFYWGSAAAKKPGSRNYPGISHPAIDALCSLIPSATSFGELETYTHCLDAVLISGYYGVPLFYLDRELVVMKESIAIPPPDPHVAFDYRRAWSLATPKSAGAPSPLGGSQEYPRGRIDNAGTRP
jgi:ABC-type oligopeptide transport system substrate-binding subunit